MTHRLILCTACAALLLGIGCGKRNVETDALRADNQRMASELDALGRENALLKQQRDLARDELVLAKAQTSGLEEQLRRALQGGGNLSKHGWEMDDTGGISLPDDFAFQSGSATLNNAGQQAIAALARELNSGDLKDTKIYVIGHTDNDPVVKTRDKFTDNWGLSAARAAAVIRELERSVGADRLRGVFRGQHDPRASNGTREGKAQNRRVNIRVSL